MSTFQSYLIYGPSNSKIREKTRALAKTHGISLDKVSPDIFYISPEKTAITIEQIRVLKSHIFQKPLVLKFKLVVVENAHVATVEAQNALLKIFEEPPTQAIIILESENKENLLPTITSRAVLIKAEAETIGEQDLLLEKALESALLKVAEIDDPKRFIDEQIIGLSKKLSTEIRANQYHSALIRTIEDYKEAKLMITANVNPTFVLTNLILSTQT